jgi:hypothetical protein
MPGFAAILIFKSFTVAFFPDMVPSSIRHPGDCRGGNVVGDEPDCGGPPG